MSYQNGKVYIIKNTSNDKVYIGSTINELNHRFCRHRYESVKSDRLMYCDMRNLGIEKFCIELIEHFPCNNRKELAKREGHYIEKYNSIENGYNTRKEGRTPSEWRNDNKEKISIQRKGYYDQNKESLKEYYNDWYKNDKSKKLKYMKKYNEDNKDKKREYDQNYYEINKIKRKEKIECQCGSIVRKDTIKRHNKSKKHIKYMEINILG